MMNYSISRDEWAVHSQCHGNDQDIERISTEGEAMRPQNVLCFNVENGNCLCKEVLLYGWLSKPDKQA